MSWIGRNMAEYCEEHHCDQGKCVPLHLSALGAELAELVLRDPELFQDSMRWQEIVVKARELKSKLDRRS